MLFSYDRPFNIGILYRWSLALQLPHQINNDNFYLCGRLVDEEDFIGIYNIGSYVCLSWMFTEK